MDAPAQPTQPESQPVQVPASQPGQAGQQSPAAVETLASDSNPQSGASDHAESPAAASTAEMGAAVAPSTHAKAGVESDTGPSMPMMGGGLLVLVGGMVALFHMTCHSGGSAREVRNGRARKGKKQVRPSRLPQTDFVDESEEDVELDSPSRRPRAHKSRQAAASAESPSGTEEEDVAPKRKGRSRAAGKGKRRSDQSGRVIMSDVERIFEESQVL